MHLWYSLPCWEFFCPFRGPKQDRPSGLAPVPRKMPVRSLSLPEPSSADAYRLVRARYSQSVSYTALGYALSVGLCVCGKYLRTHFTSYPGYSHLLYSLRYVGVLLVEVRGWGFGL